MSVSPAELRRGAPTAPPPGRRTPGALATLTAGAATVAALAPTLSVPAGVGIPVAAVDPGVPLLPAAVLLGVPGLAALVGPPRLVVRLRPLLGVAWLGVLVAAGAVLDVVLVGVDAGAGVGIGVATGGWGAVAAALAAGATGVAALVAGAVERREVPLAGEAPAEPDRVMLPLAALAAVLAVPGLGGPLARDALGTVGGPWQDPGVAAWAGLAGLLGVAVAVLLAPRARPARASALLGGAAVVLVVRLAAPVPVGGGTLAAGLCLLAVVGAVAVAAGRVVAARRSGVARVARDAASGPDGPG